MIFDTVNGMVEEAIMDRDYENFKFELLRNLSIECPFSEEEFMKMNQDELTERLNKMCLEGYKTKSDFVAQTAYPVIKNVYEDESSNYENIVVPFTDGKKNIQVVTPLEKAYQSQGKELINSFEKNVILAMIDLAWKEHLREMDDLKQSVQGAVYEQKDPLLIYKFEAFELFKQMLDRTNREVVSYLLKANLPQQEAQAQVKEAPQQQVAQPKLETSRTEVPQFSQGGQTQAQGQQQAPQQQKPKVEPVRVEKKVGRNEPCPCGSGKKYKHCHGK
jgi:preprotein translocase subunit SecA